jgi:sporadic carbohydrate cluster 2OG-Fe(II) oxygenase
MPNDISSKLDIHSDCWSGDSPYQINLWLPFTDCFSSNSMFVLSEERTKNSMNELFDNIENSKYDLSAVIKEDDFINLKKGRYIIFNPGLLHGNIINQTNQTRASINIRYKSIFSPDALKEQPSRAAGIYYKIFKISEWTLLARELNNLYE